MNLQAISAGINALVTETAHYIKEQRKGFSYDQVSDKGLNQLVSYVDIEAEKQLVNGLSKLVPEAGFITEENTSDSEVLRPLLKDVNIEEGLMDGAYDTSDAFEFMVRV